MSRRKSNPPPQDLITHPARHFPPRWLVLSLALLALLGSLAAIAGPAGAASGLEALDRSLTVKASFYDPMFEEDSVIVGSPIPDLLIEGVRLDGLSAERIKRETEVHVARWFGIGAEFFAVTITEINHIPVVEVLDHVDRVLITSASLSLAPNGEVPAA